MMMIDIDIDMEGGRERERERELPAQSADRRRKSSIISCEGGRGCPFAEEESASLRPRMKTLSVGRRFKLSKGPL